MSDDDRAFPADGSPYLNARRAAIYCGFEPGPPGTKTSTDPQMRAFWTWASSRGLHQQPGRAVYRRTDLDAAIRRDRPTDQQALDEARRLARQDVADSRRRARLVSR